MTLPHPFRAANYAVHWLWLAAPGERKMATARLTTWQLLLWRDDL